MTLIVGLWTQDGVILASDSQATIGSHGISLATHESEKLTVINDRCVLGASGPVGLSQIYSNALEEGFRNNAFTQTATQNQPGVRTPVDFANRAEGVLRPHWELAVKKCGLAAQALQQGDLTSHGNLSALIGFIHDHKAHLVQYSASLTPELATPQIPFAAIGSGELCAYPFLKFTLKVLTPPTGLDLKTATTIAVWVVHHAIEAGAPGVGGDIQVARIEKEGSDYRVRKFTPDEVNDHVQQVQQIEAQISSLLKTGEMPEAEPAAPVPEKTEADKPGAPVN